MTGKNKKKNFLWSIFVLIKGLRNNFKVTKKFLPVKGYISK